MHLLCNRKLRNIEHYERKSTERKRREKKEKEEGGEEEKKEEEEEKKKKEKKKLRRRIYIRIFKIEHIPIQRVTFFDAIIRVETKNT